MVISDFYFLWTADSLALILSLLPLVLFGLNFVKETVIPPSMVLSPSWALRKKMYVSSGFRQGLQSWLLRNKYIEYPPIESLGLSWEYLCPTQYLLFCHYLWQSWPAGEPSFFCRDVYTYCLWSWDKSSHGLFCPFLGLHAFLWPGCVVTTESSLYLISSSKLFIYIYTFCKIIYIYLYIHMHTHTHTHTHMCVWLASGWRVLNVTLPS